MWRQKGQPGLVEAEQTKQAKGGQARRTPNRILTGHRSRALRDGFDFGGPDLKVTALGSVPRVRGNIVALVVHGSCALSVALGPVAIDPVSGIFS